MSELWIQPIESSGFEDGDVFTLISDAQISWNWILHFTSLHQVGFNNSGYRARGTLQEKFLEKTSLYKFERLTRGTCRRTNLQTKNEVIMADGVPFFCVDVQRNCVMNLNEFLIRRLKHPQHRIFGREDKEIWFSPKKRPASSYSLQDLWNDIETDTPHRHEDHLLSYAGPGDKASKLMLSIDDPAQSSLQVYQSGYYRKRDFFVPWRDLDGIGPKTIDRVEHLHTQVDVRGFELYDHSDIIEEKQ